ncbi:MAG: cobalt transporter CbiM [Anaerolineae bacterium]|nr:cobalt transporter CbiM [Anaerolineae bacterium]
MHIPDGYLSPATCVVMYAAAAPFWYRAAQKVKAVLTNRTVPLLSIFAAFSFVIMMFNAPVPDGTTAHAVGGTLMAIILGPWAATIGVSIALLIQAIFFGDGGILAFGANCFNIAVVLPFVGYVVYRLIAGDASLTSSRHWIGAAVGGYVGINAAALMAAIEFGVQPALFHAADGTPLYCPYGLSQAIPAMLFAHLTIAGFAEAVVTGGVVAFLQRSMPSLMGLRVEKEAVA